MVKHSELVQRRKYPRTSSQATLEISHDAFGCITLNAKNSSLDGFFALKTSHTLPPKNTLVEVVIKRNTGVLNQAPVIMRVAHVNDEGMGLEFV